MATSQENIDKLLSMGISQDFINQQLSLGKSGAAHGSNVDDKDVSGFVDAWNQSGGGNSGGGNIDYATLANLAGEAGIDIGSIANLIGNPTTDSMQAIYDQLGIADVEKQAFAKPAQSTEDMYNELFQSSGLADLKSKIATIDAKISDTKQQLTDSTGGINENPWLSEASRVGRVKRLTELANSTINNLLYEQGQAEKLYNTGLDEINAAITRRTTDFSTNQEIARSQLSYLTTRAENLATAASNTEKEKLLRYVPEYLQSTINTTKAKEKAAQEAEQKAQETAYKAELKKQLISAGLSYKTDKGGTLSVDKMEQRLAEYNKQAIEDAKRAAAAKAAGSAADKAASQEDKDVQSFYSDANSLRQQMSDGKTNWSYAWNLLRTKYPSASIELIDQTLGLDYRNKYDK